MKIKTVHTKTVPTVSINIDSQNITFHSKYDPLKEAAAWVSNSLKMIVPDKKVVVIGLGAGYHIQQLADELKGIEIEVIEFNKNYYKWFCHSIFYDSFKRNRRIKLTVVEDKDILNISKLFSEIPSTNILIQKQALKMFPKKFKLVENILNDIRTKQLSINSQLDAMKSNFEKNDQLKDPGIKYLHKRYKENPMLLVSAGPSLSKQIPLLKEISKQGEIVIGAVGTAVKPLYYNDIIPDFIMITDPNKDTVIQLEGIETANILLFYLSTTDHNTVIAHNGPRNIVYQKGFKPAEHKAEFCDEPLISTGGSVATTLLDLMVYLGAYCVGLVGQDLAYTNGLTHANLAPSQKNILEHSKMLKVQNYYQDAEIATSNSLNIYRKWFEDYSLRNQNKEFYNCTEGGAFIKGWQHISLKDFQLKHSTI